MCLLQKFNVTFSEMIKDRKLIKKKFKYIFNYYWNSNKINKIKIIVVRSHLIVCHTIKQNIISWSNIADSNGNGHTHKVYVSSTVLHTATFIYTYIHQVRVGRKDAKLHPNPQDIQ